VDLSPSSNGRTANKFEYDPLPLSANFSTKPELIIELLQTAVKANPKAIAMRQPVMDVRGNLVKRKRFRKGRGPGGTYKYHDTTWEDFYSKVMDAAVAFKKMGLQTMDAVNIRGVNSPEWLITFFGCIAAGGLPVGLYPSDSPGTLKYKATDSGAAFIVLGKVKDLSVYSEFIDELPSVKTVIYWDVNKDHPEKVVASVSEKLKTSTRKLYHWDEFVEIGNSASEEMHKQVKEAIKKHKPGQAGSVVYTSGTTGNPKGVLLSQDSLTYAMRSAINELFLGQNNEGLKAVNHKPIKQRQRIVSYLPLNHIAGQELDMMWPLGWTGEPGRVATIYFPAICFLKKTCFVEQLVDTKPTTFLGVPAVWSGLKGKIEQASSKGLAKLVAKFMPKILLKKLGLNAIDVAVSGAGAISKETLTFFHNLGINILNVYGQSESAALGTSWRNSFFKDHRDFKSKFGSIGKPIACDVKIKDPDSQARGEILMRGRNLMLGYLNNPAKTMSTFTEDGWLLTGDQGKFDDDGFVYLTGRLKEIMKDLGGEMILPVQVEEGIKKACNKPMKSIIEEVILVGDGEFFVSALITLLEEKDENIPNGKLIGYAKRIDPAATSVREAKTSQSWKDELAGCIGEYNKNIAAKGQERIYRYYILPKAITGDDAPDLMTPTQKIKRTGVVAKYTNEIQSCGGGKKLTNRTIQPCASA